MEYGVSTPALLEMDLCLALGLAERPGLVLQGLIGQPHGALDTQLHHTTFAQIRAHWRFPPIRAHFRSRLDCRRMMRDSLRTIRRRL